MQNFRGDQGTEGRMAGSFSWPGFIALYVAAMCLFAVIAAFAFAVFYQYANDEVIYWKYHRAARGSGWNAVQQAQRSYWLDLSPTLAKIEPGPASWGAALGALALLLGCYPWRRMRLTALGGAGLALAAGGRAVRADTAEPAEKRLLALLSELSGRSGRPAPALFIADDEELQANAAVLGTEIAEAAILVTRAAAHDTTFGEQRALLAWQMLRLDSRALERDARIAALLYGLTLLFLAGVQLKRWGNAFRERGSNSGVPTVPFTIHISFVLQATSFLLRLAGFPGIAAARLIVARAMKATIFDLDTGISKDPLLRDGLAALLERTRHSSSAADTRPDFDAMGAPPAIEFAHAFMVEPCPIPWLERLLASHPDPEQRQRRIAPDFSPDAYRTEQAQLAATQAIPDPFRAAAAQSMGVPLARTMPAPAPRLPQPPPELPEEAEARDMFFLALDKADHDKLRRTDGAAEMLLVPGPRPRRERRWMLGRALDTLVRMPAVERIAVRARYRTRLEADGKISLDEFLDWLLIDTALAPPREAVGKPAASEDVAVLVSLVAHAGAAGEEAAAQAYRRGAQAYGALLRTLLPRSELRIAAIEAAVQRLAADPLGQGARFMRAAAATARADGRESEDEKELIIRLAYALDCPNPLSRRSASPAVARSVEPVKTDPPALPRHLAWARDVKTDARCTRCGAALGAVRARGPGLLGFAADWTLVALALVIGGVAMAYSGFKLTDGLVLGAIFGALAFLFLAPQEATDWILGDRFRYVLLALAPVFLLLCWITDASLGTWIVTLAVQAWLLYGAFTSPRYREPVTYRCTRCGVAYMEDDLEARGSKMDRTRIS